MAYNSIDLVHASLRGDLESVQRLLSAGADVNSKDENGIGTLLSFTPEVTKLLLESGANPNSQTNEDGAPVLAGVAYMNHVDCVGLLLEAGADPNASHSRTGETALHSCLSKPDIDHEPMVRLLIEYGADPNQTTVPGKPTAAFWRDVRTRGESPLHRAAAYAGEPTLRALIAAGGDRRLRDANGDSPQSWASWHWRPKSLVDLLAPESVSS